MTAAGNGETQIDLRWAAPTTDGGAAITGYRIEIAEDITSWNDLVADTGSTATTYFHTSLTAGTTRHYRVSAINSAGTGPASNIATGNHGLRQPTGPRTWWWRHLRWMMAHRTRVRPSP